MSAILMVESLKGIEITKIRELQKSIKSPERIDPERLEEARKFNDKLSMITPDDLFRKFAF